MKKIAFLLCAMFILLSSCGPSETSESPNSQSANTTQPSADQNSNSSFEVEPTITGESDVEIGLKNIKIDTNGASLTDGQKKVKRNGNLQVGKKPIVYAVLQHQ